MSSQSQRHSGRNRRMSDTTEKTASVPVIPRRSSAKAEYDSYYPSDAGADGDCSDDGRGPLAPATLAVKLTSQPWHQVGAGPPPIGAATEFDGLVDQMSALLGARLRDLLVDRLVAAIGGVMCEAGDAPPPCEAGDYLRHDERTGQHVLAESVARSVRAYVTAIGRRYNAVAFHSFEHAAHVAVSANKLLSMISGADKYGHSILRAGIKKATSDRHMLERHNVQDLDFSFGIRRDPRILFAVVFSALIHDVGHKGVPNSVLVEEEDELAILHNDVSVAEQNSLQVAFSLMQREEFTLLKKCICPNPAERKFFRKKVISMVMVTDIADQERVQIVASRWSAAFPPEPQEDKNVGDREDGAARCDGLKKSATDLSSESIRRDVPKRTPPPGRRDSKNVVVKSEELRGSLLRRRFSMFATDGAAEEFATERRSYRRLGIRTSMDFSGKILDAYQTNDQLQQHAVLETIMNVADVAHTMQAFPVFCKWNKRLFKEFYLARLAGRLSFDPEENWYEGQIDFLSHVIIPLSQKMKTCGVFGTTGYVFEYFAVENKKRWTEEGEEISEDIIRESKEEVEKEREQQLENGL